MTVDAHPPALGRADSPRNKLSFMAVPMVDSRDKQLVPVSEAQWSRELVKQIAKDVGDAVIIHIELMYPAALTATPGTFQLSVRNCIFNEIMAAIEVNDAGQIAARIAHRKRLRRHLKTAYRKMRAANDAEES
jgi:hypothetical protein